MLAWTRRAKPILSMFVAYGRGWARRSVCSTERALKVRMLSKTIQNARGYQIHHVRLATKKKRHILRAFRLFGAADDRRRRRRRRRQRNRRRRREEYEEANEAATESCNGHFSFSEGIDDRIWYRAFWQRPRSNDEGRCQIVAHIKRIAATTALLANHQFIEQIMWDSSIRVRAVVIFSRQLRSVGVNQCNFNTIAISQQIDSHIS